MAAAPGDWTAVPEAPMDPILGMTQRFQADTHPRKVNVGIGAYRTDDGKPLVLSCVKKAEKLLLDDSTLNKEYLPQRGDVSFSSLCQKMIFGEDSQLLKDGRVATAQTLSGTGALRLGAEFAKRFAKDAQVFISDPTWGTHTSIMEHAGVTSQKYRYWDAGNRNLDLTGMLEDLRGAPDNSLILLHAAAHNPTGVDPTKEEWAQILEVCKEKKHLAWFDNAYQGFATGDLETDAFAMRLFAASGVPMFVSQSFAKNFGLYGERVGTFSVTCATPEAAKAVISNLDVIIRNLYSSPPKHGALVVKTVLSDPALYQEWREELMAMSVRIQDMRKALFEAITALGTPGSWTHITSQIGMFSFTGLTVEQSKAMVDKHHVYMLSNGRISMAGVTTGNVKYLAQAIDDVVRAVNGGAVMYAAPPQVAAPARMNVSPEIFAKLAAGGLAAGTLTPDEMAQLSGQPAPARVVAAPAVTGSPTAAAVATGAAPASAAAAANTSAPAAAVADTSAKVSKKKEKGSKKALKASKKKKEKSCC